MLRWGREVVFCFAVGGDEEEFVHVVDVVARDVAPDVVVGGVVLDLHGEGGHGESGS